MTSPADCCVRVAEHAVPTISAPMIAVSFRNLEFMLVSLVVPICCGLSTGTAAATKVQSTCHIAPERAKGAHRPSARAVGSARVQALKRLCRTMTDK